MLLKTILHRAFKDQSGSYFWAVNDFLALVVIYAVIVAALSTDSSFFNAFPVFFQTSEIIIGIIFCLEYVINIYLSKKKLRYIFSIFGIIDLLAFLPSLFFFSNFEFVKILRVSRLLLFLRQLRILKIINVIRHTYKKQVVARDVALFNLQVYGALIGSFIILFAFLLFGAERNAPNTHIHNVGDGVWLSIITMATVGYGDIYPVTLAGKIIASIEIFIGMALFGLLISVVGKTLQELIYGEHFQKELNIIKKIKSMPVENKKKNAKRARQPSARVHNIS